MLRLTAALLAVSTLTGCVTERIVYRDRYPDTATYERSYAGDGSYRESRPVGSGRSHVRAMCRSSSRSM